MPDLYLLKLADATRSADSDSIPIDCCHPYNVRKFHLQTGSMKTEEITIRVDAKAARAYKSASEEDRRKLDLLLSLRLTDATRSPGSLRRVIRDISRKAQERGLTPEILRSALDER